MGKLYLCYQTSLGLEEGGGGRKSGELRNFNLVEERGGKVRNFSFQSIDVKFAARA